MEIKHEELTNATSDDSTVESVKPTNPDKFLTCALMDMQPVSVLENEKQNRILSKSEVAVKGDDWGWIMWTHISALPEKESNVYRDSLNFIYRLLFVKKTDNKWEVEGGWEWKNYVVPGHFVNDKFIIAPPIDREGWFTPDNVREYKDASPFQAKTWAGIGEVDKDEASTAKDLLQSISIYINEAKYAEFWGSDGNFAGDNLQQYTYVQTYYEKGVGWKKKQGLKHENASDKLKEWYAPLKGKKIRWSNLADKCDAWSKIRNQPITSENEDIRALCYNKVAK